MICIRGLSRALIISNQSMFTRSYNFGRFDSPPPTVIKDYAGQEADSKEYFHNRNPRNPELLNYKARTLGYSEDPLIPSDYYNRIVLEKTNKHITARLIHHESGEVLQVSTEEPWIKSKLYRTYDRCAALNVGRVLAYRMKAMGINCANFWDPQDSEFFSEKTEAFMCGLVLEGVKLSEPPVDEVPWQDVQNGETPHHFHKDSDQLLEYLYRKADERKALLDQ